MECITNESETDWFNSDEMKEKKKKYLDNMKVTQEDILKVMNIPQRTPEWIRWRSCRMTASNYGSATGHNVHCKPKNLLMNLLWDTFKGNKATQYGTDNEPVAAKIYEDFLSKYTQSTQPNDKVSFYYPGLIICKKHPWLAVSPDGLPCLHTAGKNLRFLLEIKCPFKKEFYPHVPHYYFDQIQGIMGILQLPFCYFVVYTPEKTQIRRYNFDEGYWKQFLFPQLEQFYMNEYLPRLILKEEGKLKQKELEPSIDIVLDDIVEEETTETNNSTETENNSNDSCSNDTENTRPNHTFDFIFDKPVQQKADKKRKIQ